MNIYILCVLFLDGSIPIFQLGKPIFDRFLYPTFLASQSFSFSHENPTFSSFFRISLSLPNVLCKPPNCCYICYCKSPSNDAKIITSITLKLSVSASLVGSEIISAPKLKTELILTVSRRSLGLGRQLQFPWRFKKITFCFLVVRTARMRNSI